MGRSIYEQAYVNSQGEAMGRPGGTYVQSGTTLGWVRLTHHRNALHGLGYLLLGVFEVNQAAGEIVVIGAEIE